MKKWFPLLLVMAFLGFQTIGVLAAMNPDTGPGCGLGKLVWSDYKHQKNITPQVERVARREFNNEQTPQLLASPDMRPSGVRLVDRLRP